MADDATAAAVAGARWQALTNGHYHSQRESFVGLIDRLLTFAMLVSGAGAVTTELGKASISWLAIAVTVFAAAQLVFAIGPTARNHAVMREKYFSIAADLEAQKLVSSLAMSEMLRFAGQEGPIYHAVHALSENWGKCAVYGEGAGGLCKVSLPRRFLRHVWRQSAHDFHCD